MNEIIPGILEQEWVEIEKKLEIVSQFSRTVHIDLIDGKFAPNKTFLDPTPFSRWTEKLFIELHLMVEEPVQYLDAWGKVGVKRFVGQIEQMSSQYTFIEKAKEYGEVVLAIDGKSALEQITEPLTNLDGLLIMTIDAGFSGQEFVLDYAKKCEEVRAKNAGLIIEVDGGINLDTLSQAKTIGANRFVCTSALFEALSPEEAYLQLTEVL